MHLSSSFCTEELNTVSESAEHVDVASSISTNLISPNTDPPTQSPSEMMCERSCEELANLFQELKGLRVVVSNLIDGLQKVVSLSESHLSWDRHVMLLVWWTAPVKKVGKPIEAFPLFPFA